VGWVLRCGGVCGGGGESRVVREPVALGARDIMIPQPWVLRVNFKLTKSRRQTVEGVVGVEVAKL
jgi:hypothetical protein